MPETMNGLSRGTRRYILSVWDMVNDIIFNTYNSQYGKLRIILIHIGHRFY